MPISSLLKVDSMFMFVLIFLVTLLPTQAKQYTITATGSIGLQGPNVLGVGVGYANEASNSWYFLRYLNPQLVRLFLEPLLASSSPSANSANWVQWVGNQYGVSFQQQTVTDKQSWLDAVAYTRSVSNSPSEPSFFNWLRINNPQIKWDQLLKNLNTTFTSPVLGQVGNPQYVMRQLQLRNYLASSIWNVRCRNLDLQTSDSGDPEYWKRRWEMYRLFYFGGWWMAQQGVDYIELYNEPDLDKICEKPELWVDDVRIRSQALQSAYSDYSSWSSTKASLVIAAPTTAAAWSDGYSNTVLTSMNTPFPSDQPDSGFTLANEYSYHKYGSFSAKCGDGTQFNSKCHSANGNALQDSYINVQTHMVALGASLPVYISEFSCFTNNQTSSKIAYFNGVHTYDQSQTAACMAAMVSGTVNRDSSPNTLCAFKFVQTLSVGDQTVKNGLFFGGTKKPPYDVTGSTKSGEAYRLLLKSVPKERHNNFWQLTVNPPGKRPLFSVFIADTDQLYFIYAINEEWNGHVSSINVAALPGIVIGGTLITQAVDDAYQGAISNVSVVPQNGVITMQHPPGSVYMMTMPKVATATSVLNATGAVFIKAGSNSQTNYASSPTMQVSTSQSSADDCAVGLVKFSPLDDIDRNSIVSAILQFYLQDVQGTLTQNQVLTVISNPYDWEQSTVTWDSSQLFVQPPTNGVTSTYDNFINWGANSPAPDAFVMGMPTVPIANNAGILLRLDVTEYVKRNNIYSFAVVRMFRYDQSSAGPADNPQGVYEFGNLAGPYVPQLIVDIAQ